MMSGKDIAEITAQIVIAALRDGKQSQNSTAVAAYSETIYNKVASLDSSLARD